MSGAGITSLLFGAFLLLMKWKVKIIPIAEPVVEITTRSDPQVPCYFVFGDSLSDCGNNNDLYTKSKANYRPYGIDFPNPNPTGRFTNNRTFVDVLSELLGFDNFIPHFTESMTKDEASQGVNYASGGGGILYETGRLNLGQEISFNEQVLHHQSIVEKIASDVNLTQCLYTINIGSNDYINNYFNDKYITSQIFSQAEFATYLIDYYGAYTKILYGLGARKIAFYLLTEIGCALGLMKTFNTTSCVETVNNATEIFNTKLVTLIDELNDELSDAKFTYINSTAIDTSAFIDAGITEFYESCCTARSDGQCEEGTTPCTDRDVYYFWDLYHPTDTVYKVLGDKAYNSTNTTMAYPYDITTLVQL